VASRPDFERSGRPVEDHFASSRGNLHAFWRAGAEVILTCENQAEGLLGCVWKVDGVGHDAAFKINVGFGLDGDIGKGRGVHWSIIWGVATCDDYPARTPLVALGFTKIEVRLMAWVLRGNCIVQDPQLARPSCSNPNLPDANGDPFHLKTDVHAEARKRGKIQIPVKKDVPLTTFAPRNDLL
jgi:hypothetical protein